MSGSTKLFSSWFCPFAQRAWIALIEKGTTFEYVEIDPYNKTAEFLAINPRGLVPVIVQGEKTVYESPICIEFVDEAWPDAPHLLPRDPWERAKARILGDLVSKRIVPTFYQILQRQVKAEQEEAMANMLKHLQSLSKSMSKEGPFMMGKNFGYADIMLVPFTLRFDILQHYRGFTLPKTPEYDRIRDWMGACHVKESVRKTMADADRLLAKYQRYEDNSAKTEVAEAIRTGGTLP